MPDRLTRRQCGGGKREEEEMEEEMEEEIEEEMEE